MERLKGKVAFITGSGSGIGRAAAVIFANSGMPKAQIHATVIPD